MRSWDGTSKATYYFITSVNSFNSYFRSWAQAYDGWEVLLLLEKSPLLINFIDYNSEKRDYSLG